MGDSLHFPPIRTPQDIISKVNSQTTEEDLKPLQDYAESLISEVQKQRLPLTESSSSSRRPSLSESSEISDLNSLKDEVQKALHKLGRDARVPAEHEAKVVLLNIMARIQSAQNIFRESPSSISEDSLETNETDQDQTSSSSDKEIPAESSDSDADLIVLEFGTAKGTIRESVPSEVFKMAEKLFQEEYRAVFNNKPFTKEMQGHYDEFFLEFVTDYRQLAESPEGISDQKISDLKAKYQEELQTVFEEEAEKS